LVSSPSPSLQKFESHPRGPPQTRCQPAEKLFSADFKFLQIKKGFLLLINTVGPSVTKNSIKGSLTFKALKLKQQALFCTHKNM
jgi:hypothetical protein